MTLVAINNASMWYKPLDIFIMPFIFRDRVHANAVINGQVGQDLFENYRQASGNRIISVFEWGDWAIFNSKRAINHPDDLAGIKIRVPKNAVMVDTYNAFGATATAIDWGELYNALQQGPPTLVLTENRSIFLRFRVCVRSVNGHNASYSLVADF